MGLRTASVRRPHVAPDMAPALTDPSAQNRQTFNKLSTPQNSADLVALPTNKPSPPTTIDNRDSLENIDSFDSFEIDNRATIDVIKAGANNRVGAEKDDFCATVAAAMSDAPPAAATAADDEFNSNLELAAKTPISIPNPIQNPNLNSNSNAKSNNIGGGDELLISDNVDDLMQVIKSMDRAAGGGPASDFISDLNTLSSFEKQLLDDVDMMNMTMEEEDFAALRKENQAADQLADLLKKHAKINRRLDFLRRRAYKLQLRHMGIHVSQEMAGVFEFVHRGVKSAKQTAASAALATDLGPDMPSSVPEAIKGPPKPISGSMAKSLAKKMEVSSQIQANSAARQRLAANHYFGAGSSDPTALRSNNVNGMVLVPVWPQDARNELQKVTGMLKSEVGVVQKEFDSEATESSSGGESCDEMQAYANPHQQYLSIQKRSLWKYSTDRAAIAARWTWLQSQITDLEYRIRQHTELHKKIRSTKGAIQLGGVSPPPPHLVATVAPSMSSPPATGAVNGYRGQLPGAGGAQKTFDENCSSLAVNNANNINNLNNMNNINNINNVNNMNNLNNVNNLNIINSTINISTSSTINTNTNLNAVNTNLNAGNTNLNILNTNLNTTNTNLNTTNTNINTTNTNTTNTSANTAVQEYQCARTRPLLNFRKRKLLLIGGLHAVSKKAARPSSIRCNCAPPGVPPCALCTGRTDPTYPRDPPETMSRLERIAHLDAAFHPVFSLAEDVSQKIHFDAIMKTIDWQQRSSRMKSLKVLSKMERLDKSPTDQNNRLAASKLKIKLNAAGNSLNSNSKQIKAALSAKLKSKIRGRKSGRHSTSSSTSSLNRKRLSSGKVSYLAQTEDEEMEAIGIGNNGGTSRSLDTPNTSPLLQMQAISGYKKNHRIHSYDIDNIVIPYSVAASTRVEKLQYKEILTPKWRIADPDFSTKYELKNNGVAVKEEEDSLVGGGQENNSDIEDLSEEAMIARHERCEHEEKKRFLSYLKLPIGYGRSRAHKRTDSRAESSGANTPDPMSPHAADATVPPAASLDNNSSPITSPPATPQAMPPAVSEEPQAVAPLPSISAMIRRRTVSQSRHSAGKDRNSMSETGGKGGGEEGRCASPETVEVAPYERRIFPLPDDIYEKMLKHMPDHQLTTNDYSQDSGVGSGGGAAVVVGGEGATAADTSLIDNSSDYMDDNKLIHSPAGSDTTESALGEEDPNDPEWMEMEQANRDRHKR